MHLQGNDLTRIDGLAGCNELRELILDKNRIRYLDVYSLAGLSSLKELRIEENGLRSLSHFNPLTRIQILALGYNRISELGEVEVCYSMFAIFILNVIYDNFF